MTIKEIIQKLNTTMTDASEQESPFESWLILNEGIINAIDALKALDKQKPVAWEQFYPDIGKPKFVAQPEQDNTYIYASSLATAIWQKHYMKESPKFALLDTTEGVLTQIDNMTCGLVREKPAQQENQGKIQTVDSSTERKAD